jgi:lantibiotic biosynthesis protein
MGSIVSAFVTSLYEPLDFVTVRAPLLPVERYWELTCRDRSLDMLSDPRVRRALQVGSVSLASAVDRFASCDLTLRDADRMRAKLLRYQIRMTTRPTPYGLFAGVGLARWADHTDLKVIRTAGRTRMRPDMRWLTNLVRSAEANSVLRRRLRLFAAPNYSIEAGRVLLNEGAVSIRATSVVRHVLAAARFPIDFSELVDSIRRNFPAATQEKTEKLLDQLWEQGFMLTDLSPPLTVDDPAAYVLKRLAEANDTSEKSQTLQALIREAAGWENGESDLADVLLAAGVPEDGSKPIPVQVDMALNLSGHINETIAHEAARAADLLLRLTPAPGGNATLAEYRQRFLNKYGYDREVPLLEVLHPHRGLGPASGYNYSLVAPNSAKASQRSQALLDFACRALRSRDRVVYLADRDLELLETWKPDPSTAPLSLDLNVLVAASSPEAIDRGEFLLAVGPNLGASSAGRNLGRFADLIGDDAIKLLRQVASSEERNAPDELVAELVYWPPNARLANVVVRPSIRAYEVAFGVTPNVNADKVVPLDKLVLGVAGGRFYVRWPSAGKRIRFSIGHMLSYHSAPPVIRLLSALSNDARSQFSSFDWGPAGNFEYLPRVQYGRIVLSLAQWRLRKNTVDLNAWRKEWDIPRYVCVSAGDNRLILDLDDAAQAGELKTEISKLPADHSLTVQEVLPALSEAWLSGEEGHYYSELIVSLALRRAAPVQTETRINTVAFTNSARLRPPGSDWLFVKLYCPRNIEDEIVTESMLTIATNLVAAGWAESWFFVRYSDPDSHIRLRFHGTPEKLTRMVFPELCAWANDLASEGLCLKTVFDTYEQELEATADPKESFSPKQYSALIASAPPSCSVSSK